MQVRVEEPVRRALRGVLPEQRRRLRAGRARVPRVPVRLELDGRVDADGLQVLGDDLQRGDPVGPAADDVDLERDRVALRVDQLAAVVGEAVVGEQLLGARPGCRWRGAWPRP